MKVFAFKPDVDEFKFRAMGLRIMTAVAESLKSGPVEIEVKRPSKSRDQEKKYHAILQDIARDAVVDGGQWDFDCWKAVLVDEFDKEMADAGTPLSKPGRVVLSRDGRRVVTVRPSTRDFLIDEASQFIEFLFFIAADLNVTITDPALKQYEQDIKSRGIN